jgi:hypothetical protein
MAAPPPDLSAPPVPPAGDDLGGGVGSGGPSGDTGDQLNTGGASTSGCEFAGSAHDAGPWTLLTVAVLLLLARASRGRSGAAS